MHSYKITLETAFYVQKFREVLFIIVWRFFHYKKYGGIIMFKKLKCLLAAAVVALSMGTGTVTAFGAFDEISSDLVDSAIIGITPMWAYTSTASSELYASGHNVTLVSDIEGFDNVTKIAVNQYLERYDTATSSWRPVKSWSSAKSASYYTVYNYHTVLYDAKYRLKTVAYVYVGTTFDSITAYSATISVS